MCDTGLLLPETASRSAVEEDKPLVGKGEDAEEWTLWAWRWGPGLLVLCSTRCHWVEGLRHECLGARGALPAHEALCFPHQGTNESGVCSWCPSGAWSAWSCEPAFALLRGKPLSGLWRRP